MNRRPDPAKAIHVKRGARRTPTGIKSCTTNIGKLSRRELRILRDEIDGKAPQWTYTGICYRPTGRWHDTKAGGEYVTTNVQEIVVKRHIIRNQDVCVLDVMSGKSRVLKRATICDITEQGGQKFGKLKLRGRNIPVCYDDDEWVAYV